MPTSKDPIGRVVNNAVQSNRYANGLAKDVAGRIDQAGQDLQALLYKRDPTQVKGANRRRRIRALNTEAGAVFDNVYSDIRKTTANGLVDYAAVQETWAAGTLDRLISGAAVEVGSKRLGKHFWRALISEDPTKLPPIRAFLVQGDSMAEWWASQRQGAKQAFRRQIQHGMAQQETIGDIVRRVRGRAIRPGRYVGGVVQASTREAGALVRTAVNQIATRAHQEAYKANSDITKSYEYVATLDNRTTMICASLDGQVFVYGEGPVPPQHFNCRSTTVPVVDWEGLGVEPPPVGMRASPTGPVSAKTDYQGWLKGQNVGVQNKVLGVERAKLFRDGKVSLGDLVRKDGSTLTLDELTERIG